MTAARVTTGQDIEQRAAVAHLVEHAADLPPETLAQHVAVELALPVTDELWRLVGELRDWTKQRADIEDGRDPLLLLGPEWTSPDPVADAIDLCDCQIDELWKALRTLPTGPLPGDQVLYQGPRTGEMWDACRQQPSVVVDQGHGWAYAGRPGMSWSAPAGEMRVVARAVYVDIAPTTVDGA